MSEDKTVKPVLAWESESKAANDEPFLSVYHLGGYYYSQRAGTHSVAFYGQQSTRQGCFLHSCGLLPGVNFLIV